MPNWISRTRSFLPECAACAPWWARKALRSRPRTDESSGRPGGDHQIGGAETIGADIAQREQAEIQKALQLDLPVAAGEPIPFLYVQMDGTGVPVVKKETVGRVRPKVTSPYSGSQVGVRDHPDDVG
jgi:hypothetical protein